MNTELIKNEIIIDWKHVFLSVVKKWWAILLCLIVGAGCGFGLGIIADEPVYECQAVYVLSYSGGESIGSMASEYSFLTRILYNCTEVLSQNTFTKKIADDINAGIPEDSEAYLSVEQLRDCITYDYATQGTLIYVMVDTQNPELSYRVITSITNHLQDHIREEYQLAGIDSMVFSLVNTPELPEEPVESSTRLMFTAIGAAAFAFICFSIIAFAALTDTRIKKEDDLKNHFNVPVLGIVPNFHDPELYNGGYYKYGKSN